MTWIDAGKVERGIFHVWFYRQIRPT